MLDEIECGIQESTGGQPPAMLDEIECGIQESTGVANPGPLESGVGINHVPSSSRDHGPVQGSASYS
jgi:hypothetical protein